MDAWSAAVQFLLIDDRAQVLADAHPLTEDGGVRAVHPAGLYCGRPGGRGPIDTQRWAMSVTIIQVETIVVQALDDLEAERIDVATALRLVATIAWRQGLLAAERSPAELP
jgi:hypothetical protein